MYARTRRSFFWTGMKQDILTFVAECDVCQCHKGETINTPGTLQPLPIPALIWTEVSMDFITGLPKSGNKSVIMVVVDRLSKYAHFCALPQPFTPTLVAQTFMDQIFKLHGMPTSIVSDRDPIFTSNFWQELFRIQGTQIKLSTSYHPQTDGQTEAVNKCLETYLRCFTSEKQHIWVQWLPLAEWWYNTNYHATTKMTPYEAVYGQLPPSPTSYLTGCSKVQDVDQLLQHRATMLAHLCENLHQAQNCFHVSCLKKVIGNNCRVQTSIPELDEEESIWLQPEQVLDTRDKHLRGRIIKEVLVKWKDTSPDDATWDPATILQQFPQLQP
eukprot:PITA_17743